VFISSFFALKARLQFCQIKLG